MIDVRCFACQEGLDVPGALLFSPPDKGDACVKFHLCSACFVRTVEAFRAALPTVLEQRFASHEQWLNVRAFDDTTAEECAQWQAAAEHLGHAANCMSILNAIERADPNG